MNLRSLRFRLVSWYALWLGGTFLVAAAGIYLGLRYYLAHNLAVAQLQRADRVAVLLRGLAGRPERQRLAEVITARFAPEASGRFIRVIAPDGTVLYQSGPPVDHTFDPVGISPTPRGPGIRRETLLNGTTMILASTLEGHEAGPLTIVECGESFDTILGELRRLLAALAGGLALVAAVALAVGARLVRQVLSPVEALTRAAERISSTNLGERLPVPPSRDELAHLAESLNRMIARLEDALQHNQRFLADASHELRTPLTILRSRLESMVPQPGYDTEQRETLGELLDEVIRLSHLVENLLVLSRLDAGQGRTEVAPVDLAELAASTTDQMCLMAEDKGLSVTCETPWAVVVQGDRARLKQVIVNLLDNAIKYTPRGRIVLRVTSRDGEALCEVRDDGIGVPPSALPHLFDRFFRVDKARSRDLGGAGIGLSIVKAICVAHGGRVEVESSEEKGTCFRVRLPLADSSYELQTAPSSN